MKSFQQAAVIPHRCGPELLLMIAVITLVAQLSWPAALRWWSRPAPGAIGIDRIDSYDALAAEYLAYLPDEGEAPWPLVVFLHGSGQRGNDPNVLRNWGPFRYLKRTSLPAIVAAPQCLPHQQWEPNSV